MGDLVDTAIGVSCRYVPHEGSLTLSSGATPTAQTGALPPEMMGRPRSSLELED